MTRPLDSAGTIGIVSSSCFDFGPADVDTAEISAPAGGDFAEFIQRRLVAAGSKYLSEPVPGEGGWTFRIELGAGRYLVFIHWAPIGNPPADHWVIQPDICKPLLRLLLGRRTADHEIMPLVRELRRALEGANEIQEVRWITREEFASLY